MFNLEYVAANLGVDIEMGGLSMYESPKAGEVVGADGKITLTNTATAFGGSVIAWYKQPADANWQVANVDANNKITIPGASAGDVYCVKYQYQNPSARFIAIKTQYVPKTLHLVILSDLYSGETADIASATKYGRIITDIPNFQLDGSMDLNLTATSAATVSLAGNALGVESGDSCEEDPYYGTMTEEIFGSSWEDSVVALAIENSELELASGDTDTLVVRAVYGGSVAANRQPNSNFTFAVESGTSATVSAAGVVTASGSGDTIISVTLTNRPEIVAYAQVTVE